MWNRSMYRSMLGATLGFDMTTLTQCKHYTEYQGYSPASSNIGLSYTQHTLAAAAVGLR